MLFILLITLSVYAQENSPFSRYGIGDLYPAQTIASRAMGGLSAAFADGQTINSSNPASYGNIQLVTYDIGISLDARILRDNNLALKYNATNFAPSYLQIGLPLSRKRKIGFAFGLKPVTRINYNVQDFSKILVDRELNLYDSLQSLYQGNGGLNQAFFGIGKRWKNLTLGFNGSVDFGKKNISTTVDLINDTTLYYKSLSSSNTAFWGASFNGGFQYDIKLHGVNNKINNTTESYYLRVGANVTWQQKLHANTDVNRETFFYDANGAIVKIDSVYEQTNVLGKITLPTTYTAGFMFIKSIRSSIIGVDKWAFGAEYDAGKWSDYRFYDQPDKVVDNWMLRVGGQITPDPLFGKNVWSRAVFRLGFFTGQDYINADNNKLKVTGLTLGAGFNLRRYRPVENQFTLINTALEIGKRGSSVNNVTENYFKLSVGFSLSDISWFIKRKYE
ncbi:MAG: hypothetical protein ACR2FN_06215 [Chitinophagaceae bacterium]